VSEDQWKLGDRTIQCYAFAATSGKTMVGSVKGLGSRTPKS